MSDTKQPKVLAVPTIKKAGLSRQAMMWVAFTIFVFAIAFSAGAYNKYYRKGGVASSTKIQQHTGEADPLLAQSLIGASAPVPEPEPEPEPEPVKLPEAPKVKPPQKRLQGSDLFPPFVRDLSEENARAKLNEARRGRVALVTDNEAYGSKSDLRDEYRMEDDLWQGEERTDTSFPVDMERVIPLTSNISALLINEINSEQGGKVTAQVEQNIYGGHGRKVLIPSGSKAVGYFVPLDKIGQKRLTITWIRIITPDGINIHTGNAEMADAMGRTGITGYMDNKYIDKYGIPLLITTIQAAAAYAFPVKSQGQAIMVETYGNSMANMGQTVLDETMQIKPIVEIPAGSRINIAILKDIWFPEPEHKTINAQAYEEAK